MSKKVVAAAFCPHGAQPLQDDDDMVAAAAPSRPDNPTPISADDIRAGSARKRSKCDDLDGCVPDKVEVEMARTKRSRTHGSPRLVVELDCQLPRLHVPSASSTTGSGAKTCRDEQDAGQPLVVNRRRTTDLATAQLPCLQPVQSMDVSGADADVKAVSMSMGGGRGVIADKSAAQVPAGSITGGVESISSSTASKGGLIDAPTEPTIYKCAGGPQEDRILIWDFSALYSTIYYALVLNPDLWDGKTYTAAELCALALTERRRTDTLVWDGDNKLGYLFRRDPDDRWIKEMFADRTAQRREIKRTLTLIPEANTAERDKLLEEDAQLKFASNSVYGKMGAKYDLSKKDIDSGYKKCKPIALLVATVGRFMLRALESLKDDDTINYLFGTRVVAKYTDSCVTLHGHATPLDVPAVSAACVGAIRSRLAKQADAISQEAREEDALLAMDDEPYDIRDKIAKYLYEMMSPDRMGEFSVKLEARGTFAYFPGNKSAYAIAKENMLSGGTEVAVVGIRRKNKSNYYKAAFCQLFDVFFRTYEGTAEQRVRPEEIRHMLNTFAEDERARIPGALEDYIHCVKSGQPCQADDDDIASRKDKFRGGSGDDQYKRMIAIKPSDRLQRHRKCARGADGLCDRECRGPKAAFVLVQNAATRWVGFDEWDKYKQEGFVIDANAMFDACFGQDIKRLALPVPDGCSPITIHNDTVLDPAMRNIRVETVIRVGDSGRKVSRRVTAMSNNDLVVYLLRNTELSVHEIINLLLNKVFFDFEKDFSRMTQSELDAYFGITDVQLTKPLVLAYGIRKIEDFIATAEQVFPCLKCPGCDHESDSGSGPESVCQVGSGRESIQKKGWRIVFEACDHTKLSFHIIWGVATSPDINKAMACILKNKCGFSEVDTGVYSPRHSIRFAKCVKILTDGTIITRMFLVVDDSTAPELYASRMPTADELLFSFISATDSVATIIDSPLRRTLPHPVAVYLPLDSLGSPNALTAVPDQILAKIAAYVKCPVTVARVDAARRFHLRPTSSTALCPFCHVHHDSDNWLLTFKSDRPYAPRDTPLTDIGHSFVLSCAGHSSRSSKVFRSCDEPTPTLTDTSLPVSDDTDEDGDDMVAEYGPPPPADSLDHPLPMVLEDAISRLRTCTFDMDVDDEPVATTAYSEPVQAAAPTTTATTTLTGKSRAIEVWLHGQEPVTGYALALGSLETQAEPGVMPESADPMKTTMLPDPKLVVQELFDPRIRDGYARLSTKNRAVVDKLIVDASKRKDFSASISDILRIEAEHLNATRPFVVGNVAFAAKRLAERAAHNNPTAITADTADTADTAAGEPQGDTDAGAPMRSRWKLHRAANSDFVTSTPTHGKITTFSAMMGLGKTHSLLKWIHTNVSKGHIEQIIVFTPRITLSHDDMRNFSTSCPLPAGRAWELYSDICGSISMHKHPFVIIQVDSACRLDMSSVIPNRLLAVYDEIETDLTQLESKSALDTFLSFIVPMLIERATCFIPDAFLSDTTRAIVDFIAESVGSSATHIRNYQLPDAYTYFVHGISSKCKTEVGRMAQIILAKASEGKRIYVPCAYSGIATTLFSVLKKAGIKTILFSGDNEKTAPVDDYEFSAKNRDLLADLLRENGVPDECIASGRVSMAALKRFAFSDLKRLIETEDILVVITTTTLCCGVSIDKLGLFYSVVGMFGKFADSRIQIQMLERVRNYSSAFGHLFVCMDSQKGSDTDRGDKSPVSNKTLIDYAIESGDFHRILGSSGQDLTARVAKLASGWGQLAAQEYWLEMLLGALLTTGACVVPVPRIRSFCPYHIVSPTKLSLRAVASFAFGAIPPPLDVCGHLDIAFPSGHRHPSARALQTSSYGLHSELSFEAIFLGKIALLFGLDTSVPTSWGRVPVALAVALSAQRAKNIATKLFFCLRHFFSTACRTANTIMRDVTLPDSSSAAACGSVVPYDPQAASSSSSASTTTGAIGEPTPPLNRVECIEIFTALLLRMLGSTPAQLSRKIAKGDTDTFDIIAPFADTGDVTEAAAEPDARINFGALLVQQLTLSGTDMAPQAAAASSSATSGQVALQPAASGQGALSTDEVLEAKIRSELRLIDESGVWNPSDRIRVALGWFERQEIKPAFMKYREIYFSTPLGTRIRPGQLLETLEAAAPIIDDIVTLARTGTVLQHNSGSKAIQKIYDRIVDNIKSLGCDIAVPKGSQDDLPDDQKKLLKLLNTSLSELTARIDAMDTRLEELKKKYDKVSATVAKQNAVTEGQRDHHPTGESKQCTYSATKKRNIASECTRIRNARVPLVAKKEEVETYISLTIHHLHVKGYRNLISRVFAFFSPFLCATKWITWTETTGVVDTDLPLSKKNPEMTHHLLTLHTL